MFSLLEIWGHLYLRTSSWFCVGKTWILGLLTLCQRSQKSNSITFDFSDFSYTEWIFLKVNSHLVQDLNNYIFTIMSQGYTGRWTYLIHSVRNGQSKKWGFLIFPSDSGKWEKILWIHPLTVLRALTVLICLELSVG